MLPRRFRKHGLSQVERRMRVPCFRAVSGNMLPQTAGKHGTRRSGRTGVLERDDAVGEHRRQFTVRLLTPGGQVCSCQAFSTVFPASDGLAGVLGGRAPLAALLGSGPLTIDGADGRQEFFLTGGFAHLRNDVLTILAEECTPVQNLDLPAVEAALAEAMSQPAPTDADSDRKCDAVAAARAKARAARKHPH